jgi:hypothetical protein
VKLTGLISAQGAGSNGRPLTCKGTLGLDRAADATAVGGVDAVATGYAVAPPNGIPFRAISDRSSGKSSACGLAFWNSNASWGRYQAYVGGSRPQLPWTAASMPSVTFSSKGAHSTVIAYSYTCSSRHGCKGVESAGRKYFGSVTLGPTSHLTFSART